MIYEELVIYEVAKLAKEKGFDVPTDFCYEQSGCLVRVGSISAPTQSLLQRWLREEKGIIVEVFVDDDSDTPLTYNIHQYKDWNWECVCHHHGNYYDVMDWELCLEDALKYSLENLI